MARNIVTGLSLARVNATRHFQRDLADGLDVGGSRSCALHGTATIPAFRVICDCSRSRADAHSTTGQKLCAVMWVLKRSDI
jgi:hypothetical protein